MKLTFLLQTFAFIGSLSALQVPIHAPSVSPSWKRLGPFPVGTRESQILPPLNPDKSILRHSSILANGGFVEWDEVTEEEDGWVNVGDERIRWNYLSLTAGWAIFQHQIVYHRTISIPSPALYSFSLLQGSEFSLSSPTLPRRWFAGNIYSYSSAPPHYVHLNAGQYELSVVYLHDIRVMGQPSDGVPRGRWQLQCQKESPSITIGALSSNVVPTLVDGWLMGGVGGVSIANVGTEPLELLHVTVPEDSEIEAILLEVTSFSALQTRWVAFNLTQTSATRHESYTLPLTFHFGSHSQLYNLTVPYISSNANTCFKSTFLSNTGTPSFSMYTAPRHESRDAILALHGAGVDPSSEFWTKALPARDHEWVVWPMGMTEWGWDWHGGSLRDVQLARQNLEDVKVRWHRVLGLAGEAMVGEGKVAVVGHSNGGQGAWFYASRFPDSVVGAVPAAAYTKIQDYAPYTFSVGNHYRDPMLTGVLNSALSSFDNDLHASNLNGLPILARHGADDDNVPVYHSRQMFSVVQAWTEGKVHASLSEVPGEKHWFDSVLSDAGVTTFLDRIFANASAVAEEKPDYIDFTVSCVNPDECGSFNGFKIVEVGIPGRVARIWVRLWPGSELLASRATIKTSNVASLSIDYNTLSAKLDIRPERLKIDDLLPIEVEPSTALRLYPVAFPPKKVYRDHRRYGPLISILSSPDPIVFVIGSLCAENRTSLASVATRLSTAGLMFGKINSEILWDWEWLKKGKEEESGNLVLLGGWCNLLARRWGENGEWKVPVQFVTPSIVRLHTRYFQSPTQGTLILAPRPSHPSDLVLSLSGNSNEALEMVARAFPTRTGVTLPEWVVLSSVQVSGGVEAAGFWGQNWSYEVASSYM